MKEKPEKSLKQALFDLYYDDLNEMQKKAVYHVKGPLLVLAGAGSGKTTVLTRRIAHIIRFGDAVLTQKDTPLSEAETAALNRILQMRPVNREMIGEILAGFAADACEPSRILAITFTNKAAGEIKNRLTAILGEAASEIWAGTFHSICVRLMRRYIHYLGYGRDFTIFDAEDSKKLITAILKDMEVDEKQVSARSVQNEISRAKTAMRDAAEYEQQTGTDFFFTTCARVYLRYQEHLRACNAVDFDDILNLTVELLEQYEEPRRFCQERFSYVLVDEYQDTNVAQFRFVQIVAEKSRNVMVVGDDDQSIYKFRGATIENILSFDKTYPDALCVFLEQNYRSTGNILAAANAVILNNAGRRGKSLWCDAPDGEKLGYFRLSDQEEEAIYIAGEISRLVTQGFCEYRDCAVLYRVGAQANALESVFAKSGLPHRQLSGIRFYDRAEIKDILAYLCVIQNPKDDLRLSRILNVPRRGIGDTTLARARALAEQEQKSLFEILSDAASYEELKRSAEKIASFVTLIESLRRAADRKTLPELFSAVMEQSGYLSMLEALGEEGAEKIDNTRELVSSAVAYEEQHEEASLSGFLEEAALVSDIDNYDENANAAVLMTIHSAKGLEFKYVFLPGFEETLFPSARSMNSQEEIEEERRLAYVALTRAKVGVVMTSASCRLIYGHTVYNPISRFLREIPETLILGDLPKGAPAFAAAKPSEKRRHAAPKDSGIAGQPVKKIKHFAQGDRVLHPIFGEGLVLSAKPMAQDVLYEIAFEDATKKIMGNYAKLAAKE